MANKKRTQNKRSGKKQRRRTAAKKQRGGAGNKNITFYLQENDTNSYTSGVKKYGFIRNIDYLGNSITKNDILSSFNYNSNQEIHLYPGKTYNENDSVYSSVTGKVHVTPFGKYKINLKEYSILNDSIRQDEIAIHPINEI